MLDKKEVKRTIDATPMFGCLVEGKEGKKGEKGGEREEGGKGWCKEGKRV